MGRKTYRYGFFADGLSTAWGRLIYERVHAQGQWLSADELHHRQSQALQRMVRHACRTTPFYREHLQRAGVAPEAIRTPEDLVEIPVVPKLTVKRDPQRFWSSRWRRRPTLSAVTSGSSGSPLPLRQNYYQVAFDFASIWMVFKWAGYQFRDAMVTVRSYVPTEEGPLWYGDALRGFYFFSAYHLNDENMRRYVQEMRRIRPKFLRGYPHSLHIMARFCLREGIDDIRPLAALTCSEKLNDQQRKDIETAFSTRVFDRYGNIEMVAHAGECERHEGYHIDPFYGVLEVVDEDGNPSPPGVPGRVVATGLTNFAMPLIRYEIGDLAVRKAEACSCGRAFPLLSSIEGRVDDVLRTPDGRQIPPVNFYTLFQKFPRIDFFQLVQERVDAVTAKLVVDRFDEEERRTLTEGLRERLGPTVEVRIEVVDELEKGAFGKFRCIRSHVTGAT